MGHAMRSDPRHGNLPSNPDALGPAHRLHEALYRPVLFAGAVPELVLVEVATVIALIVLVGLHLATLALAVLYATIVHSIVVWVTAQDPQMPAIYLRSLGGKDYYAPHTAPFAAAPSVRPSIPPVH